jgi:pyruvate oxidase
VSSWTDAPSPCRGRFDAVTCDVLGDAALTLTALVNELDEVKSTDQRPDVAARWDIWRHEKSRRAADNRGRGVSAAAVFAALSQHLSADAVVTVDVGNHAYSPGRPIVAVTGDGGFGQYATDRALRHRRTRPVVRRTRRRTAVEGVSACPGS